MSKEEICNYLESLGLKCIEETYEGTTYRTYTLPSIDDIGFVCRLLKTFNYTNIDVWNWSLSKDDFPRPLRSILLTDIDYVDLPLLERTVKMTVLQIRNFETERRKKILNEI